MCGIIGYIGPEDPTSVLLDGLRRLEYRGYDSAGIAVSDGKNIEVLRAEGRLENLEKRLLDRTLKGTFGIGHTRWATHGSPSELNAHPHRAGSVTLVHNGIIENYLELSELLGSRGRTLISDTDSEIVAHLVDEEIQMGKDLEAALLNVLPMLRGSYAFVILNDKEPETIAGVRNGAPLILGIGDKETFVASDVQALINRTNRIVYLRDHEFAMVRPSGVTIRDIGGKSVKVQVTEVHWTPDQVEKAGYRHFMLKEIHEQPQSIARTIEPHIDHRLGLISLRELGLDRSFIKKIRRVSIVACGTARHAGMIGKYLIERWAGLPVDVDYGSEFRYRDPILEDDTLLIAISQSGETADTLAAFREGKGKKIRSLSICNVRESSLTRESDYVLYTHAGPEIGVASTKAFTTQLVLLYLLSVELGYRRGNLSLAQANELTQDVLSLPHLVENTLTCEKAVEEIALEHQEKTFFFYMGRNIQYPVALEGALKLKEISYAHAEGYAAGELKHGPIALIDRSTAALALAPKVKDSRSFSDSTYNQNSRTLTEKMMSNIQEVKSRGGSILTLGNSNDATLKKESQFFIPIPEAPWGLTPILTTVPLQLFAYYMALQRGTDVDKPRNLAKSVTVE